MAFVAMTTPALRVLLTKAFGENQAKLVVAERTNAQVHIAPVSLSLNAEEETLTEVLIVSLVWGARSVPQDHLDCCCFRGECCFGHLESVQCGWRHHWRLQRSVHGHCAQNLSSLLDTLPGNLVTWGPIF
eukprot:4306686-Amphidinium_carterae.1